MAVGGPVAPDGTTEVQIDFPVAQRTKNAGGRDGSGLCVFTSIGHAARWQNERRLEDFQAQMRAEVGGGHPSKVEQMIAKYGGGATYLQYEGADLTLLRTALQTGRMPCVTYDGRDPHYRGRIAHMVNLVHLDDRWACVLDNNHIEADQLVWMTPAEFRDRWLGGRHGWTVILLHPAPPPVPRNGD